MTLPVPVVETLRWVDGLARRERIPFQLIGAVAAHLHDAPDAAPVTRVELLIHAAHLPRLLRATAPVLVQGPWRRRYACWDLVTMTVDHGGVPVTVGVADGARIRIGEADDWREAAIEVDAAARRAVGGLVLPVAPVAGTLPVSGFSG